MRLLLSSIRVSLSSPSSPQLDQAGRTSFFSSFAAPPVLRMHYGLRLQSMLPATACALHAHTSDGDGEASLLPDQFASRRAGQQSLALTPLVEHRQFRATHCFPTTRLSSAS